MLKALLSKLEPWGSVLQTVPLKLAGCLIETIPPRDLTVTRLGVTEGRLRAYWKTHGHLPARLTDLPPLKRRDDLVIDGWGKPIKYDITGTSTVMLSSDGSGGPGGGRRLKQSIQITFDASEETRS